LALNRYKLRGIKAKYTEIKGAKHNLIKRNKSTNGDFTRIPVLNRSKVENCGPFAIFNILQVPLFEATKEKFLQQLLGCSHCELQELTDVSESFGIHLDYISDPASRSIDWLLSREFGLYLITKDIHCISVDANRKLIFDCGFAFALHLNKESLMHCGFSTIDKIRSIVLPKYLMPSTK